MPFTAIHPELETHFETLRKLAGEPRPDQPGRRLPPFDRMWLYTFFQGHQRRIQMWKKANEEARERRKGSEEILAKLRLAREW